MHASAGAPFTFLPAVKVHMLLLQCACGIFELYLLSRLVSTRTPLQIATSPVMAIAAAAGEPSAGNTNGIFFGGFCWCELVQRNCSCVVITGIGGNSSKDNTEIGVLRLAGQSSTTLPNNLQQLRELYAAANRQDIIAACRRTSPSESGDIDGMTCNKGTYDLPNSTLAALQAIADW